MEEIDSGSPLPKIVGGTPTTTAKLAGMEFGVPGRHGLHGDPGIRDIL